MISNIRNLLLLFLIIALGGCQASTPVVKTAQPQPQPAATQKVTPAPPVVPAEPVVAVAPRAAAKPAAVTATRGELYVLPTPAEARIRVMNIVPKFVQGMKLPAGRYSIEVTAPGYQKYLQWITLEADKMKRLKVDLKPQ